MELLAHPQEARQEQQEQTAPEHLQAQEDRERHPDELAPSWNHREGVAECLPDPGDDRGCHQAEAGCRQVG